MSPTAVLAVAALLLGAPSAPASADSRELWGAATILPGRVGPVEIGGYDGEPLGRGSRLTLTAPAGTTVTGAPLRAAGYRGSVDADGDSAAYLYTGSAADPPWVGRTFPFVLAVPADAVPGTRLDGCATRLTDANRSPSEDAAAVASPAADAALLTADEGDASSEQPVSAAARIRAVAASAVR